MNFTDPQDKSATQQLALTKAQERHKVFISYCRKNHTSTRELVELLKDNSYQVCWDNSGIAPAAEWRSQLGDLIMSCDSVICVLSTAFIESKTCKEELACALRYNKRLIPVIIENIDGQIPSSLEKLNYIFLCPNPTVINSGFYQGQKALLKALESDQHWLRQRTHYLEQAQRWSGKHTAVPELSGEADAYLLHDAALADAWHWFRQKPERTNLDESIRIYLQSSQDAQDRRRTRANSEALQLKEALRNQTLIQNKLARFTKRSFVITLMLFLLACLGNYYAAQKTIEAGEHNAAVFAREAQMLSEKGDHAKALQIAVAADPAAQAGWIERWLKPAGYQNARFEMIRALVENKLVKSWHAHDESITAISAHPNKPYLLSASRDRSVKLWDISGHPQLIQTLTAHTDNVAAAAFSPDGQYIVTGSYDQSAYLWRIGSEQPIQHFTGHTGSIYSITFLPDGEHFLTGSYDQSIKLWRIGQEQPLESYQNHTGAITALQAHADGQHFLSGGQDHTIKLWQIGTTEPLTTFVGHQDGIKVLLWHPDGQRFFSASSDHSAKLWRIGVPNPMRHWGGHTRQVQALASGSHGDELWTASEDQVRHWDLNHNEHLHRFTDAAPWSDTVSFSYDAQFLYSGSSDGELRQWRLLIHPHSQRQLNINALKAHEEAFSFRDYHAFINNLEDGANFAVNQKHKSLLALLDQVKGDILAIEDNAQHIIMRSPEGFILRAALDNLSQPQSYRDIGDGVSRVQLSKSGKHLLVIKANQELTLWTWPTAHLVQAFEGISGPIEQITISDRENKILATNSDGLIQLWISSKKRPKASWKESLAPQFIRFLHDDNFFLSADKNNTIRLYSLKSPHAIRQYDDGKNKITSLSVSGSNSSDFFLTGNKSGTVSLWSIAYSKPLLQRNASNTELIYTEFFDNGNKIKTLDADGRMAVWHVPEIITASIRDQVRAACVTLNDIGMRHFSKQDYEKFSFLSQDLPYSCSGIGKVSGT